MLYLSAGLQNSMIVLEHLRNDAEFISDVDVSVGCFTNCRECGFTFMLCDYTGKDSFTWCVYEHRNSDSIIINGKKGYISINGDLPYTTDSKWDYLAEFSPNQHFETAEKLKELIRAQKIKIDANWAKAEKAKAKADAKGLAAINAVTD